MNEWIIIKVNPIGYEVADQGKEVDDISFVELEIIDEHDNFIEHDHSPHSFFDNDDLFYYDVFD